MMIPYAVPLTNQLTGERNLFMVEASCPGDAQHDALTWMFRAWGWRKTIAGVPEIVGHYSSDRAEIA